MWIILGSLHNIVVLNHGSGGDSIGKIRIKRQDKYSCLDL